MIVNIEDGRIIGYCTVPEMCVKWGLSTAIIYNRIYKNKIRKVIKLDTGGKRVAWFIPENAPKPL